MEIIEIDINKIKTNPNQPRKEFDKEKLKELAESISSTGLINPINVKKLNETEYEIISGERRYKAHKIAGLKTISAIVRNVNESENVLHRLIENIQREDLTEYEKAQSIREFANKGFNGVEISKLIGKSQEYTASLLNLTNPKHSHLAQAVKDKEITLHTFEDIKNINNKVLETKLLKKTIKDKISSSKVREMAYLIKKSPKEVTKEIFKDNISLEQAKSISKIENPKLREKMLKTHKEIKKIDKDIDKKLIHNEKKVNDKANTIKIKEFIDGFRVLTLENQKTTQKTIKSLLRCKYLINLMDEKQLSKFKYYQKLFENNLENSLRLSETLK